jgi:hypothetical protein
MTFGLPDVFEVRAGPDRYKATVARRNPGHVGVRWL